MGLIYDLKTWRFWRHLVINVCACGGILSGLLQFHNVLYPNDGLFQGSSALIGVVLASIIFGLILSWPRPIEQKYNGPNTRIRIIKGNLLNLPVVIGTCNTFDTEIPNIISPNSLQGQALSMLFNSDVKQLDGLLSHALAGKQVVGKIVKSGKQDKYEIGTVAAIPHGARLLFFTAYTEMDIQNTVSTTVDNIWKSLQLLWREVSARGNDSPVAISALGGGLARISAILPAQDSIRLIALSFMFASRASKVAEELIIVVRPGDYERLDRLELQSFLSSLRAS